MRQFGSELVGGSTMRIVEMSHMQIYQHDHRAHASMGSVVLLDARSRDRFTSFREIHISVMSVLPSGGGPVSGFIHLSAITRHETIQVKYTNQNVPGGRRPTRSISEAVAHQKGWETYNAFGSDCGAGDTKGPALLDMCNAVALK